MVISFGRVLWMVEKSGADMNDLLPGTTGSRHRMAMRCARNIVRWWMVEFHERAPGNRQLSYPGEVTMPRELMPIALWLGVREYRGIWRAEGGGGEFDESERLGLIGDNRMVAVSDVLSVYGFIARTTHGHTKTRTGHPRKKIAHLGPRLLYHPENLTIRDHHQYVWNFVLVVARAVSLRTKTGYTAKTFGLKGATRKRPKSWKRGSTSFRKQEAISIWAIILQ